MLRIAPTSPYSNMLIGVDDFQCKEWIRHISLSSINLSIRAFLFQADSLAKRTTAKIAASAIRVIAFCNLCMAISNVPEYSPFGDMPSTHLLKTCGTVSPSITAIRRHIWRLTAAMTKKKSIARETRIIKVKRNLLELVFFRTLMSRSVMLMGPRDLPICNRRL